MGPIDCGSEISGIAWTSGIEILVVAEWGYSVVVFGTGESVLLIALMNEQ